MKKFLTMLSMFAIFAIPAQSAFAWSYEGPNSLNPFTGFRQCNKCVKVKKCKCKCKCKKPKLTKCEKLHGVKIKKVQGEPCGCAAPIQEYIKIVPMQNTCNDCQKVFP